MRQSRCPAAVLPEFVARCAAAQGMDREQGQARRPHAERSPQGEHRTGEDLGAAAPLQRSGPGQDRSKVTGKSDELRKCGNTARPGARPQKPARAERPHGRRPSRGSAARASRGLAAARSSSAAGAQVMGAGIAVGRGAQLQLLELRACIVGSGDAGQDLAAHLVRGRLILLGPPAPSSVPACARHALRAWCGWSWVAPSPAAAPGVLQRTGSSSARGQAQSAAQRAAPRQRCEGVRDGSPKGARRAAARCAARQPARR